MLELPVVSQFGKYFQAELVEAGFIHDLMPASTGSAWHFW